MYVRKVGRPRLEWATEVYKLALSAAAGHPQNLEAALLDEHTWRCLAKAHVGR